jgi:hypothetical protein
MASRSFEEKMRDGVNALLASEHPRIILEAAPPVTGLVGVDLAFIAVSVASGEALLAVVIRRWYAENRAAALLPQLFALRDRIEVERAASGGVVVITQGQMPADARRSLEDYGIACIVETAAAVALAKLRVVMDGL